MNIHLRKFSYEIFDGHGQRGQALDCSFYDA